MKIGIVVSYISKNPAGLERYSFELIKNLISKDKNDEFNIYIKKGSDFEQLLRLPKTNRVNFIEVGWGKLWKDIGLLKSEKSDFYLFTGPVGPLFFRPQESLVIFYDFAYKTLNKGLHNKLKTSILDFYSRRILSIVTNIVCISEETKKDLIKYFNVKKQTIKVIYPGFNNICELSDNKLDIPSGKFFLFVGTIKERKNVLNIVKAYKLFLENKVNTEEHYLIIGGKYSKEDLYYKQIQKFMKLSNLEKKVVFTGHITDGELAFLYKNASALIYPSFIEGFGLPVLEAMACGLPVITSNISALKEIADSNAILVNPNLSSEISSAMEKIITDNDFRKDLIEKGKNNAKNYSWEKMADEFIDLIHSNA